MDIFIAKTDKEIVACCNTMRELRPHILAEQFVQRVRRQECDGYRLAFLRQDGAVVAVAGFRVGENLAWGRFLYVDDLVTLASCRSHGYGAVMLKWLKEYAAKEGCSQMHLDSGMQRVDAHRFYKREGMTNASFHFVVNI